jgi:hypothetical protein
MAAQPGFLFMAILADKKGLRDTGRDDATDAARFFSRIGYVVLAVGAPLGVVLHPLGLYVMFSIGVGLVLIASALEAEPGFFQRFLRPFGVPAFLTLIAGLAWAALSILWTPYPLAAGQLALKLSGLLVATMLAVAAPRENARATDLYLFPIGVVVCMGTMAALALSETLTRTPDDGGLSAGAIAIAALLFPAIGGLAARGRNGLARLLLILALCIAYIHGHAPLTVAVFAGYLALSLSISDLSRTARELSWAAAALILLAPIIPALAPTISAWIFHTRLASLPAPYPSLSVAADIFTHDKLRLITGHGFATVSRGVHDGILPLQTPRALAFMVWYELGVVGALLAATGTWLAFRGLAEAPARLAPYMAATLSAVIALAFLNVDFVEMTTLTLVALAAISTDVAARSQYRTTRPSAANLANL